MAFGNAGADVCPIRVARHDLRGAPETYGKAKPPLILELASRSPCRSLKGTECGAPVSTYPRNPEDSTEKALTAAIHIARWAYRQAFAVGGMAWLRAKGMRQIESNGLIAIRRPSRRNWTPN